MLHAVGQPEDEVLDRHGAVRAPTHLYRRLKKWTSLASVRVGTVLSSVLQVLLQAGLI
jgi:hypothetical protein